VAIDRKVTMGTVTGLSSQCRSLRDDRRPAHVNKNCSHAPANSVNTVSTPTDAKRTGFERSLRSRHDHGDHRAEAAARPSHEAHRATARGRSRM